MDSGDRVSQIVSCRGVPHRSRQEVAEVNGIPDVGGLVADPFSMRRLPQSPRVSVDLISLMSFPNSVVREFSRFRELSRNRRETNLCLDNGALAR